VLAELRSFVNTLSGTCVVIVPTVSVPSAVDGVYCRDYACSATGDL
jgi:hypothetical protein